MKFSHIYAIFVRQWFLTKSTPSRLVGMFTWLVLDVLLWGFLNKYIGTFGHATLSLTNVLLGAIVLWEFTSQVERGVMMSFMEDIWVNNFINYFASPLKVSEYIAGLIMTTITSSLIGASVALIIVWIGFGYNIFLMGLFLIPFVIVLFIFAVALGLLVISIIFRFGPSAEWFGWPIPFVVSILSGVYYPVSTLPLPLNIMSHIIPASYVFEGARNILANHASSHDVWLTLGIAFLLSFAWLLLGYWVFLRVYKHNLRNGSLARFSAESL
jgi:ABC-2 type transport system permease protein